MTDPIFRDPRFDALRNAIYHTARRNFYDGCNKLCNLFVILLGASVVGKLFERHLTASSLLELSVVFVSTTQLVLDLGSKARDHEFLQRKYYDLLSEIERENNPSIEQKRLWSARLVLVSGEETLTMRVLDAIAHNNAVDALFDSQEDRNRYRQRITPTQYVLRHVFAFNNVQFRSLSD